MLEVWRDRTLQEGLSPLQKGKANIGEEEEVAFICTNEDFDTEASLVSKNSTLLQWKDLGKPENQVSMEIEEPEKKRKKTSWGKGTANGGWSTKKPFGEKSANDKTEKNSTDGVILFLTVKTVGL